MMNSGKIFEQEWKESCTRQDLWVWRIQDTYVTAKRVDTNAYIPCMPADYLVKYDNLICFFELKHTDKNYITVEHDDVKGMIRKTQIDQMLKLQRTDVLCVFVLQFSEDTYAISVQDLVDCLQQTGKHSVNPLDIVQHGRINVQAAKKRTRLVYNVKGLLDKIRDQ